MAIECIAEVWAYSKATGTQLLVMLAVSDRARKEDGLAWPGIKTIAEQARISARQAHRHVDALVAAGELELVARGGLGQHHTTRLRVNIGKYRREPGIAKGDMEDTLAKGDIQGRKGDIQGNKGDTAMSPDPLVVHPLVKHPTTLSGRPTWLTPYLDAAQAIGWTLPPGKAAKFLKAVEGRLGAEKALAGWRRYLQGTEARFWSVARFAETAEHWTNGQVLPLKGRGARPTQSMAGKRFSEGL